MDSHCPKIMISSTALRNMPSWTPKLYFPGTAPCSRWILVPWEVVPLVTDSLGWRTWTLLSLPQLWHVWVPCHRQLLHILRRSMSQPLGHLPPNLGVFTLRLVVPPMRRLVRFLRLCGNVAPMRLLSPYGQKRKTKAMSAQTVCFINQIG